MIDAELRNLLVCPVDHAALIDRPEALECTECGRVYPVVDGIAVMLLEKAETR